MSAFDYFLSVDGLRFYSRIFSDKKPHFTVRELIDDFKQQGLSYTTTRSGDLKRIEFNGHALDAGTPFGSLTNVWQFYRYGNVRGYNEPFFRLYTDRINYRNCYLNRNDPVRPVSPGLIRQADQFGVLFRLVPIRISPQAYHLRFGEYPEGYEPE